MTQAQAIEPAGLTPAGEGHPGAAAAAAGASAGPEDDGFVQMPRAQIPYGGDWHKVVERCKRLDQLEADGWTDAAAEMTKGGFSGQQFLGFMRGETDQFGAPTGDPTPPGPPAPPPQAEPGAEGAPLTLGAIVEGVSTKLAEFKADLKKEREDATKQDEEARLEQQRTDARGTFGMSALKSIGLEDTPETKNFEQRARIPWWLSMEALDSAVAESIPQHVQGGMRDQMMSRAPTQAQLTRAQELFTERWADHDNEMHAARAQRDQHPEALVETLGEGAGGRPGQELPKTREELLQRMTDGS